MSAEERCSSIALALDEPQFGTASTVPNWILLQQPGPWGHDALVTNRMHRRVARALRRRARELNVRLVLIRRPGRHGGEPGVQAFFAHTGPGRPWLEGLRLDRPGDLLEIDLEPLSRGLPTGAGSSESNALHLVCTNGARDPCCAERGRPLARALAREMEDPRGVWEVSHIGGDRFAGNLLCFPHGLYYGRVGPADGPRVAGTYESGRIDLDHYRGRSCYGFAVQAAEYALRVRHGRTGVDALAPGARRRRHDGLLEVTFERADGAGSLRAVVRIRTADVPRRITCHAEQQSYPPVFDLLEVE